MKNIILISLVLYLFSFSIIQGQIADGITYQAVALDEKGKEIAGHDINGLVIHSKAIGVRFSILSGSPDGEILYRETHSTYTDQFGLFSLTIGHGEISSEGKYQKLNDVNWGSDKLFLNVEIDIRNKGDFKSMGIQQMMAVPYAFHALSSSSATVRYEDILNKPTTASGYGITDVLSSSSPAGGITSMNITNWNSSFSWGNHAGLYKPISYVPAWSDINSNPFSFSSLSSGQLIKYNSTTGKWENWTPDYLTGFSESDPAFSSWNKSTGITVSSSQVSDFQTSVTNNPAVQLNTAKNSYPAADATKLAGIQAGAEMNVNADWNAGAGDAMILNKPSLAAVATTGSYNDLLGLPAIPSQYTDAMADLRVIAGITGKVDSETGKGLSTNDYTTAEKNKLTGISSGAEVNVNADWDASAGDAMILNKPTTIAGYGITDALTTSSTASGITAIMVTNWNSAYSWGDHAGLYKLDSYVPDWTEITNKPSFAAVATSGLFSDISGKPTTISGYGITDAVSSSLIQNNSLTYAMATGSASNYLVSLSPAPTGYVPGMIVNFKANFDNTGATTLNINELGVVPIKKTVTADLDANDIKNGQMVSVIYDGANFQLLNTPSSLVYNNPNTISHGVQNINTTGISVFTVPPGVHQIYVKQYAAGGGKGQNIQLTACSSAFASGAQGGNGGYINVTVNCLPGQRFEINNGSFGNGYTSTLGIPDYGCGSTANRVDAGAGLSAGDSYIKDLSSLNLLVVTRGGGGGGGAYAYLPYMSSYTYNVATPPAGASGTYTLNSGNGAFLISGTSGGGYSGGTNGTTTIEW